MQTHFTGELQKIRSRVFALEQQNSPSKQGGSFLEDYNTGSFAKPAEHSRNYSKSPRMTREETLWDSVQDMVYDQKYNDAYRSVFQNGDEATLIKLMGRTGVVIEELSIDNLDKVLNSVTSFLN